MDNVSANAFDNEAAIIGITVADGVLLLAVFFTMVLNLILIAALIGKDNSELVLSIRVILINILAACVVGGLVSIMYHIASPILYFVSSASVHAPLLCRVVIFLSSTSSSGRVLFTAFYGVTVFIVTHFWSRPVLAPRNTKYFIIASAVLWLLAVATGIPSLPEASVAQFCSINSNTTQSTANTTQSSFSHFVLYVTLPYIIVSSIAIIITPVTLIKTSCFIWRKGISSHSDSKKALVKFGLFLMLVQGINVLSQIVIPLVAFGFSSLKMDYSLAVFTGVTLSILSQIPTNVLILVFFKPVRSRVQRWICCCRHDYSQGTRSSYIGRS